MTLLSQELWWPLLLSSLAGLSTSLGGVLAVTRTPDEAFLALLLGIACGVMSTVSLVELWWSKAMSPANSFFGISASVCLGALAFAALDRLGLPKPPEPQALLAAAADEKSSDPGASREMQPLVVVHLEAAVTVATGVKRAGSGAPGAVRQALGEAQAGGGSATSSPRRAAGLHTSASQQSVLSGAPGKQRPAAGGSSGCEHGADAAAQLVTLQRHHAGLLRLGLCLAVTMVVHNLPEGVATALSAFTDTGPQLCLAIAAHNLPEGLIIAAPIYAATGSRAKAFWLATASGLSEPLGALVALLLLRPFVTSVEALDHVLAFVGGVMLGVCALELWPEAVRCQQPHRMAQGIGLGALLMLATLLAGGV